MSASAFLLGGIGPDASVALFVLDGLSIGEPASVEVPDYLALEWTAPENRLHWTAPENRLHWSAPDN